MLQIRHRDASSEKRWNQFKDGGLDLVGFARGVMRFQVRKGCEIVVEPEPDADLDYIQAIISGELMSAVLRQRGLLTLHGSCVANADGAIGFIGHSGWGKSTLSMQFVQHGYRLLCDDVLAVDLKEGGPMVIPGYPQVKLRQDAAERYVGEFEALPAAHAQTDKRLYACADDFQAHPVPLRKLYLLEGKKRPQNEVIPVSGHQAFVELLRHTRATNLLKHPEFSSVHLQQLSALLKEVPVSLLHRRWSLSSLPELCGAIDRDLKRDVRASFWDS